MTHYNTVLQQLIPLFRRHDFEKLAKVHHNEQKFCSLNRCSQLLDTMIAQVSGRKSLRNITDNINPQGKQIHHLGMRKTSHATLARVNEKQPDKNVQNFSPSFCWGRNYETALIYHTVVYTLLGQKNIYNV